jgi:organic radical activating enzyme
MDNIISIHPINQNRLTVTLQLTTACTYSCRYCPDTLSKGSAGNFDLNQLDKFFAKFPAKEIILTITGGEPTIHPDLPAVLELAHKLGIKTQVDTNGVRTKRFYQEIGPMADVWNITLHTSQHSLDLEKITVLTDNSFVVVYIMMDPDYWIIAVDWWKQLIQIDNIKVIPLKIVNNWSGAEFTTSYTEEQHTWLLNTMPVLNLTPERKDCLVKTHAWLLDADSVYTQASGDQRLLDGYAVIKQGINNFYGWRCSAGNENILINQNGSASWANCGIKQYNHFLDIDPIELTNPVLCDRLECTCITDIRSTKVLV